VMRLGEWRDVVPQVERAGENTNVKVRMRPAEYDGAVRGARAHCPVSRACVWWCAASDATSTCLWAVAIVVMCRCQLIATSQVCHRPAVCCAPCVAMVDVHGRSRCCGLSHRCRAL
jgi:hypothetical protein